jgi:hypothetical protein
MKKILASFLISFLWLSVAQGAVELGSVITVFGSTNDFGNKSFSHETEAGTNLVGLCAQMYQGSGTINTVNNVTFNSDALGLLDGVEYDSAELGVEMWYRLAPDIGTHTMAVNLDGDSYVIHIAFNLLGALQEAPTNSNTLTHSNTNPTFDVPSAVGELVIGCWVTLETGTLTEGGGATELWDSAHDGMRAFGVSMVGASPDVTVSLTAANHFYAAVGASFAPLAEEAEEDDDSLVIMP